jgi:3D (Asp-Asp-Asp) domain-containing protein
MPLDPPLTMTSSALTRLSLTDRWAGTWYVPRRMGDWRIAAASLCLLFAAGGCSSSASRTLATVGAAPRPRPAAVGQAAADPDVATLEVTATAYNSLPSQGSGDPTLAAWGDRLKPGMKAIAVSRDLLALGLTHGITVEIEGVAGSWTVLDKMARRWTRKIDLYMGVDRSAALRWGRRLVTIRWQPAKH